MEKVKNFSNNTWSVVTLLSEIAASGLLIFATLKTAGEIRIAIAIVAGILTANVLVKLYIALRR